MFSTLPENEACDDFKPTKKMAVHLTIEPGERQSEQQTAQ